MKTITTAAILATALTLSACGGNGDDALGDRAADLGEANAAALSDNGMPYSADMAEATGDAREEAIDDADVNADAMTAAQQNALVNGAMPVEAAPSN